MYSGQRFMIIMGQSVIAMIVLYFDFATIGRSASGMNVCCGLCLKPVIHFNRIVAYFFVSCPLEWN
jgi:hypothetical protein